MTQETHEAPPTFEPVHTVELVSVNDSKIIGVSVYSGRAEVTRLFSFSVHTGQNQVIISGLPNALDQDSFRVEGRGAATIHDVTISTIIPPPIPTTSTELKGLELNHKQTEKALERSRKAIASLENYLDSVNVEHVAVTALGEVVETYESTCEKLDDKVTELEKQLDDLYKSIEDERKKLSGPTGNHKLNLKASIGVFADHEGEVEIALIYAVNNATWSAGYDIRVDMQTKEKPITLIYKGAITQSTGEDWNDIPLTLETATPTFGVGVPSLIPWTLSIYRPPIVKSKGMRLGGRGGGPSASLAASPAMALRRMSRRSPSSMAMDELEDESIMQYRGLAVSSRGNISATFTVPGTITIPSDGVAHNVTIVQLSLDSTMSWVSVPKIDAKTHLNAKIKNASEYTLLSGPASVYVDGSFISRSDVPAVSPDESFDCPLGLDPSIRITYHPRVKKVSQSGFYTKTTNYVFSQRITIFNTKSTAISNVKIIDQVPVSEDSLITVKLLSPPLVAPFSDSTLSSSGGELKVPPPVKVSSGVVVQWDGADEPGNDVEGLGKDGKFYWVCAVPSQGKVNLLLQWEVTAPVRTDIAGLY